MSKEMKKYKVLNPIGYGGRQERGTVISMDVDTANAFGPEYVVLADEVVDVDTTETVDETPLKDMKLKELREKAGELGLDTDGTKPDLIDRITLHLAQ